MGKFAVPPHLRRSGVTDLLEEGSGVSSRPGRSPPSQLPAALCAAMVRWLLVSVNAGVHDSGALLVPAAPLSGLGAQEVRDGSW